MAFLVVSPQGSPSKSSSAEVFAAADAELTRDSRIELLSFEQLGIDPAAITECDRQVRVGCWVQLARPDYDRFAMERPDGSLQPFAAHRRSLTERSVRVARFLLVLTVASIRPGRDRVASIVVDTDRALERIHTMDRSSGWRERAENAILELVRATQPQIIDATNRTELAAYFRKLVTQELRPYSPEQFSPMGRISLLRTTEGDEIVLDGKAVARASAKSTELVDVHPGSRTIAIPLRSFSAITRIEPGATSTVTLPAGSLPVVTHPARPWVLGVALTAAAAGVGFAIVSAARSRSVRAGCLVRGAEPECEGIGQPTFGFSPGPAPSLGSDEVNPRGVTWLQAGALLFGTGTGTVLGLELLGGEIEPPWQAILLGLGAGALGLAAATVLDER